MNVYTHYQVKEGVGFRWRTLLQYGSSWDIIGTMVMINPGSSKPIAIVEDPKILSMLSKFDDGNEWYTFSEDNAMRWTGELFAMYYKKQNRHELNGVIQIFNLFYVMNKSIDDAVMKFDRAQFCPTTPENDCGLFIAPVYLGFGKTGLCPRFIEQSKLFFNKGYAVNLELNSENTYLNPDFYKNSFTYPSYLLGRGKNKAISKYVREQFALLNKCESAINKLL